MTAEVVPFPMSRQRAFLYRHALYALSIRPIAADRYIERQLQYQRAKMIARGISACSADSQIAQMVDGIEHAKHDLICQIEAERGRSIEDGCA